MGWINQFIKTDSKPLLSPNPDLNKTEILDEIQSIN
jgi:hypothetical protein